MLRSLQAGKHTPHRPCDQQDSGCQHAVIEQLCRLDCAPLTALPIDELIDTVMRHSFGLIAFGSKWDPQL
jgi:hypothetical protein